MDAAPLDVEEVAMIVVRNPTLRPAPLVLHQQSSNASLIENARIVLMSSTNVKRQLVCVASVSPYQCLMLRDAIATAFVKKVKIVSTAQRIVVHESTLQTTIIVAMGE